MDSLFNLAVLDRAGLVGVLVIVALGVITEKLVWHTRLKSAEARADRWERVALDALTVGAKAGVKAAEVTADVVSSLPDPGKEKAGEE